MKNYYCGSYAEMKKKEIKKLVKEIAAVIFAMVGIMFAIGMII